MNNDIELIDAIKKRDLKKIINLINNDANINDKSNYREKTLMFAARYGQVAVIKFLLVKGANINDKSKYGETALMIAARYGQVAVIKFLLVKGANINDKSKYGETALMIAARYGQVAVIKFLLVKGANINDKSKYGETALMIAARYGQVAVIKFLLVKGANINDKNNYGETALMIAARYGQVAVVEAALLVKSANINDKNNYGETALIIAAENGYTKIVETLAYAIYEEEKWKRCQLKLPTFLNIATDKKFKTLQELANDVQKQLTNIDFKQPNPYQNLEINLNLAKLKINNEILNKIDERIEEKKSSLVKEANAIALQNQTSTTNQNTYCNIL